jgi:serine/threonine-protein phosphatase 2B catalytic subunit
MASPTAGSRDRMVPTVPEPPWETLAHHECFERVDGRQFELRKQRARAAHLLRVAAKQGLGSTREQVASLDTSEDDREPSDAPPVASSGTADAPRSGSAAHEGAATAAVTPERGSSVTAHVDPMSPLFSPAPPDDGSPPPHASPNVMSPGGGYYVEVPRPSRIQAHFAAGGRLTTADAAAIITAATEVLKAEPNVLRLAGPITVCGDVHGQFFDVVNIFQNLGGDPDVAQYLFLGDYVDRGCYSTEIVLTLFARKIVRPSSLWLLRGNHECGYLTSYFNFKQECIHKYDEATYELFLKAFDCLPLAAVVNGEFLCVHGGLSPFIRTVEDIEAIHRFRDPPQRGPMCDLLWADPMDDEEEELCPDALFLHNDLRGCSYVYTHAAACDFLQRNNLASMIRAHEAQEDGYRMYRKVPSSGMPATICIFSAPNYCEYNNLAAILLIDGRQLQLKQFHSSPQPYSLPYFMNGLTWSIPFLFDKLDNVLTDVFEVTEDALDDQGDPVDSGPSNNTSVATLNATRGSGSTSLGPKPVAAGAKQNAAAASSRTSSKRRDAAELAAARAHVISTLANYLMLPLVLRQRGRVIRAKVLAVARFGVMLRRRRQAPGASTQGSDGDRAATAAESTGEPAQEAAAVDPVGPPWTEAASASE